MESVEDGERLVGAPVVDEEQVRLRRVSREGEELTRLESSSLVVTGHHDGGVGRRRRRSRRRRRRGGGGTRLLFLTSTHPVSIVSVSRGVVMWAGRRSRGVGGCYVV